MKLWTGTSLFDLVDDCRRYNGCVLFLYLVPNANNWMGIGKGVPD